MFLELSSRSLFPAGRVGGCGRAAASRNRNLKPRTFLRPPARPRPSARPPRPCPALPACPAWPGPSGGARGPRRCRSLPRRPRCHGLSRLRLGHNGAGSCPLLPAPPPWGNAPWPPACSCPTAASEGPREALASTGPAAGSRASPPRPQASWANRRRLACPGFVAPCPLGPHPLRVPGRPSGPGAPQPGSARGVFPCASHPRTPTEPTARGTEPSCRLSNTPRPASSRPRAPLRNGLAPALETVRRKQARGRRGVGGKAATSRPAANPPHVGMSCFKGAAHLRLHSTGVRSPCSPATRTLSAGRTPGVSGRCSTLPAQCHGASAARAKPRLTPLRLPASQPGRRSVSWLPGRLPARAPAPAWEARGRTRWHFPPLRYLTAQPDLTGDGSGGGGGLTLRHFSHKAARARALPVTPARSRGV